ncbi:hypothetical protein E2C01_032970 [Portunus trituberculatus]|uniref:Uncharacterized protein n=1 Tax=Portunus trituberculatus TaxID=210409 RepID=A0A5B7F4D7_PORTR|nr:hypothetical protein [Portunus trituberculatus]
MQQHLPHRSSQQNQQSHLLVKSDLRGMYPFLDWKAGKITVKPEPVTVRNWACILIEWDYPSSGTMRALGSEGSPRAQVRILSTVRVAGELAMLPNAGNELNQYLMKRESSWSQTSKRDSKD